MPTPVLLQRTSWPAPAVALRWLAPLAIAALAGAALPAQVTWNVRSPATSPSPRCCTSMAFDVERDRAVTFGGFAVSMGFRNETWEWDGSTWIQRAVSGPSKRDSHSLVYDTVRGETLLFGGGRDGLFYGDTWAFDGSAWTLRATTGPTPRHAHAAAFDVDRGRMVVFGGNGSGGLVADTWEWDGSIWVEVTPAGASPSARYLTAMAYDQARQQVVLFGGTSSTTGPGDDQTWVWDGSAWTQLSPAVSPPARFRHTMTYDEARQRVVLFGGQSGSSFLADVWEWDGTTWVERTPTGAAPAPRRTHGMAYDPGRELLVMFGGKNSSTWFADTWELASALPARVTTFGAGCEGTAGVPTLRPVPTARPWLGDVLRIGVDNVPAGNPVTMMLGASNSMWGPYSLPVELGQFVRMTGCLLYATPDVFVPLPGTAFVAPVPVLPSLAGATLYAEAFVVDPPVNPAGVTSSNRGDILFGAR